MPDKKLFLVDGHAIAYRAYYAFIKNPLTNAAGQPTGAVFGFANYLLRLIAEYNCPYMAVVFDSNVPTFRHEMYKEYKANREEMPDDLKSQMPLIHKLVDLLNITELMQGGLEADDILAHMTRRAVQNGFEVFIVTRDKDLMQLIDEKNVRMLSFESSGAIEVFGPEQVKEKMGVAPNQIRDLLALMGDSSDNIPGVPGVGPKTAQKILEKAGSIEALLQNPAIVDNPKLQAKIEENRDSLILSRDLATLHFDVDYEVPFEQCLLKDVKKAECVDFFREMEFNSLLKNPMFSLEKSLDFSVVVPASLNEVTEYARRIALAGFVSIDTETTSLVPHAASIVGISMAIDKKEALYVPVGHTANNGVGNLDVRDVLAILRPILEDPTIKKIGQNLKYDYQVFKGQGITLAGLYFDTMVAAYVMDPGKRNFSLDAMAAQWLSATTTPIESLIGKGKNQIGFNDVPIDVAARYSGEDVVIPLLLKDIFMPVLESQNQLPLFHDIEMPLVSVLAEMEWKGVAIDTALLSELSIQYTAKLAEISADLFSMAQGQFNVNSPKQVSDILFTKLGLPKSKKTKTGLSTDVDALEKLQGAHPIVPKLLEYRESQKLLSTYIDALGPQILSQTSRLHTSFNQTVAATGRLSSNGPNLQNIPIRTDAGKRIREAFIAAPDHVLISADYSQIELRILAHVSKDPFLLQSFHDDKDIHTQTASAMYGVFPEMVTPQMRRAAKTINFGLMYGMGPINLSRQLGISFKEAQEFIDTYFRQFPTIKTYMVSSVAIARQNGYSETLLGRRRFVPEIDSQNRQVREAAERVAINTPIQGTAADIIKIAMVNIDKKKKDAGVDFTMLLQVHDELIFEVHQDNAQDLLPWVCDIMSNAYKLDVPLKVDAGIGKNWSEAH